MNGGGEQLRGGLVRGFFFASSVVGHVALKRAAGYGESYDVSRSLNALISPWGVAALAAWVLSAWVWTLALTKHRLIEANAVSALRTVLCAVVAWACLGERFGLRELTGTLLVAAGICLLRG